MPYYLTEFEGTGKYAKKDPFRPIGFGDSVGWSMIDLRPDPGVVGGFCLVHDPDEPVANPKLAKLADDKSEVLTGQVLTKLQNVLDSRLTSKSFAQSVHMLLRQPPSGKWKTILPIQDERGSRYEVYLGGLLSEEPILRGGATDNFNRANETPVAAPWTKNNGTNINLNSNGLAAASSDDNVVSYAAAASTNNMFSQANAPVQIINNDWGICARCSGSPTTGNAYVYSIFGAGALLKIVSGGFTTIASAGAGGYVDGDIVYISANGSTITVLRNGANPSLSPQTDTALTTGQPGIFIFEAGGSGRVDNWQGGDLATSALPPRPTIVDTAVTRSFNY